MHAAGINLTYGFLASYGNQVTNRERVHTVLFPFARNNKCVVMITHHEKFKREGEFEEKSY